MNIVKTIKIIFLSLTLFTSSNLICLNPNDVFPDGASTIKVGSEQVTIKKGTIFSTIKNSQEFDRLRLENLSAIQDQEIQKLIQDVEALIPGLKGLDMFDLFDVSEWLVLRPGREGRVLVGLLYLQQYPQEATPEITNKILLMRENVSKKLLPTLDKTLAKIKNASSNEQ